MESFPANRSIMGLRPGMTAESVAPTYTMRLTTLITAFAHVLSRTALSGVVWGLADIDEVGYCCGRSVRLGDERNNTSDRLDE